MHCTPKWHNLTISHLNAGFDLNGNRIQNCYFFTLFEIVRHQDCGQGDNCSPYLTMYCHVFNYRFCWCQRKESYPQNARFCSVSEIVVLLLERSARDPRLGTCPDLVMWNQFIVSECYDLEDHIRCQENVSTRRNNSVVELGKDRKSVV